MFYQQEALANIKNQTYLTTEADHTEGDHIPLLSGVTFQLEQSIILHLFWYEHFPNYQLGASYVN